MKASIQIALPTDDLRGSLVTQINSFRKTLGRTPAVLRRSVNKQFGVTHGLDDLTDAQLADVLTTLELLCERREAIEQVRAACAVHHVTAAGLDSLLERYYEGRSLDQLAADELTDLRLRIDEVEGGAAAGSDSEPAAALM